VSDSALHLAGYSGSRHDGFGFYLAGGSGACVFWAALLWAVFAPNPFPFEGFGHPALARHHLITICQAGLFTSLALLLLGVLRHGFAALQRFFDSIAQRSNRTQVNAASPDAAPESRPPEGGAGRTESPQEKAELFPGRRYRCYSDGAVEVETLLGTRKFGSIEEARLFVGQDTGFRQAA